jgi:peptide/nickel transport system substrate-binding protein
MVIRDIFGPEPGRGKPKLGGGLTDGDRPVTGLRKRIIGSGIVLALAGATVLTAGSSHAAVPSTARSATARQAGVVTWAMSPGAPPNWIFPVTPTADNLVSTVLSFQWNMWRPLYWTDNGTEPTLNPAMSIAAKPVYSNGDKTVTIKLKSGYKWSDGTAITAKDILFFIDLVKAGIKKSPGNWADYAPGYFPDNVASTSQPNASTLRLNLKSAVNPSWFTEDYLGQVVPLPAHAWARTSARGPVLTDWAASPADAAKIFGYLTAASESLRTYTSNPIWRTVDGPYRLTAYDAGTGAFTMTPNAAYGGPHASPMPAFQGVPFTSDTAEFNAVKAGSIDVGYVPQDDVPQLAGISGYRHFGAPDFGMSFAAYNYKDATGGFGHIASQLYFRQAMAHLQDQQGWISRFMHGAGAPAYGPIPAVPASPYLPAVAKTNPYPFSVADAVTLLKAHGWTVHPGGTDVCSRPGTAATECGAGIAAGTKLAFNYVYNSESATISQESKDLAAKARQAGIKITRSASTFTYMILNYLDPYSSPANENKWAMMDFGGETNSPYPTTFTLFNTNGPNQIGDYSDPAADKLIHASITSRNPAAVKNEAAFLTRNQPVLFQPNTDYTWAWKTNISGPAASFSSLTQYFANPEFWSVTG